MVEPIGGVFGFVLRGLSAALYSLMRSVRSQTSLYTREGVFAAISFGTALYLVNRASNKLPNLHMPHYFSIKISRLKKLFWRMAKILLLFVMHAVVFSLIILENQFSVLKQPLGLRHPSIKWSFY